MVAALGCRHPDPATGRGGEREPLAVKRVSSDSCAENTFPSTEKTFVQGCQYFLPYKQGRKSFSLLRENRFRFGLFSLVVRLASDNENVGSKTKKPQKLGERKRVSVLRFLLSENHFRSFAQRANEFFDSQ